MKIEIKDNNLVINISDLIDNLSEEYKKELGQSLIWSPEVFKDLIDALVNDEVVTRNFAYNIFNAREAILKSLTILEKNHFRSLLSELHQEKEERQRWEKDYWKLYHSLPAEYHANMPQREPFKHIPINHDDNAIDNAIEDFGSK